MRGNKIRLGASFLRLIIIFGLIVSLSGLAPRALAAGVSSASDTLSTIKQSVVANHTIQFTLNGADTFQSGENITVAFPTGFDLTALVSPGDFDFRNASTDETIQSGACGSTDTIRVTIASQTITFAACNSYTAEAAGSTVIIKIGTNAVIGTTGTHQITNQSAAQNNSDAKIVIGGSEASGTIAVEIVADNTFTLTATVDPQITCSIDNTSGTFGTFTIGTIATASNSPTWTISTNATSGYSLTVRSAGNSTNAGLYGSIPNYVIKSADSSENSTADLSTANIIGYGLQGTKTNGGAGSATTSISSPYTSTSNTVGRLQLTDQTLASASGAVSNATVTSTFKSVVSGLAPAGSYTDTVTYICTGIF